MRTTGELRAPMRRAEWFSALNMERCGYVYAIHHPPFAADFSGIFLFPLCWHIAC